MIVTKASQDRILGLINSGVDQGAKLVVDGRGFKLQGYENGFFVGPSLFDSVAGWRSTTRASSAQVLTQVRAKTYDDALKLVMDNEYGNGTAIFTADGDTARDFASRVNVGMVGINFPSGAAVLFQLRRLKRSAFGDLNQYGPDAFRFYTKTKTVTARWFSGIKRSAGLNWGAGRSCPGAAFRKGAARRAAPCHFGAGQRFAVAIAARLPTLGA